MIDESTTILKFLFNVIHFRYQSFELLEIVRFANRFANLSDEWLQLCEYYEMFRVRFQKHLLVNAAVVYQGCCNFPMRRDHPIESTLPFPALHEAQNFQTACWLKLTKEPCTCLAHQCLTAKLVQF